jgi:DNA-binding transcriptional regulator GbsR (MarR family)
MKRNTPASDAGEAAQLQAAKDEFITQWGAMGSAWGVNRIMAQIHALLMISTEPLTTDEIMEELKVSRGHANTNLRELCGWGLIRGIIPKGERKECFEAEKEVWKIFCIVVRERKRREIRPAINVLKDCHERTETLKGIEAVTFANQVNALREFLEMTDGLLSKVARSEKSTILPWALKWLS